MKTTRNIKKIFALIMAVVMCMSITATAFAIEPQQNDMVGAIEVKNQVVPAASRGLRFKYPDTTRVNITAEFDYLDYYVNSSSSELITVKFKGVGFFTKDKYFQLTSNQDITRTVDLPKGEYDIEITKGSANYINFYFWA